MWRKNLFKCVRFSTHCCLFAAIFWFTSLLICLWSSPWYLSIYSIKELEIIFQTYSLSIVLVNKHVCIHVYICIYVNIHIYIDSVKCIHQILTWTHLGEKHHNLQNVLPSESQTLNVHFLARRPSHCVKRSEKTYPLPSREWIHIPPWEKENHRLKMPFLGDMLIPWRVCHLEKVSSIIDSKVPAVIWTRSGTWRAMPVRSSS